MAEYLTGEWFHVTICTRKMDRLFGEVVGRDIVLNEAGEMVKSVWQNIPQYNKYIELDEFQVMPNHVHGIICFYPPTQRSGAPLLFLLSNVIKRLKMYTTYKYAEGVRNMGWQQFNKRLWQRGMHEVCIDCMEDLERVRVYIRSNPEMSKNKNRNGGADLCVGT